MDEKTSYLLDKLKEEIKIKDNFGNSIGKLRQEFSIQIANIEESYEKNKRAYRNKVDSQEQEIFELTHAQIKLKNENTMLNAKVNELYASNSSDMIPLEVFIVEPREAFSKISEEMYFYKKISEDMQKILKSKEQTIIKYEAILDSLKINKDREIFNELYTINEVLDPNAEESIVPGEQPDIGLSPVSITRRNIVIEANSDRDFVPKIDLHGTIETKKNNSRQVIDTEKLKDVLESVKLSSEELARYSRNPIISKLVRVIEMLTRYNFDLKRENAVLADNLSSLNDKHAELTTDNMQLSREVINLKQKPQISLDISVNSLVNNYSSKYESQADSVSFSSKVNTSQSRKTFNESME